MTLENFKGRQFAAESIFLIFSATKVHVGADLRILISRIIPCLGQIQRRYIGIANQNFANHLRNHQAKPNPQTMATRALSLSRKKYIARGMPDCKQKIAGDTFHTCIVLSDL